MNMSHEEIMDWTSSHPLCQVLMTICRLGLPNKLSVSIWNLDDYTKRYAEEWYNNDKALKERAKIQAITKELL